jgi:hypothetical protein
MIKKRNIDEATRLRDLGEWLKFDLSAGAANAFALSVQNPYTKDLIIDRAIVRLTTAGGTGSSVGDLDVVASATDTGDDILDGIDLNSTSIFDSLNDTDNGSNGEGKVWVWDAAGGTNDYLTLKILAQDSLTLVGKIYVHVIEAQ